MWERVLHSESSTAGDSKKGGSLFTSFFAPPTRIWLACLSCRREFSEKKRLLVRGSFAHVVVQKPLAPRFATPPRASLVKGKEDPRVELDQLQYQSKSMGWVKNFWPEVKSLLPVKFTGSLVLSRVDLTGLPGVAPSKEGEKEIGLAGLCLFA